MPRTKSKCILEALVQVHLAAECLEVRDGGHYLENLCLVMVLAQLFF